MPWRLWKEEESFSPSMCYCCLISRIICSHLFYNSILLLIVIPSLPSTKSSTWATPTTWGVGWSPCWSNFNWHLPVSILWRNNTWGRSDWWYRERHTIDTNCPSFATIITTMLVSSFYYENSLPPAPPLPPRQPRPLPILARWLTCKIGKGGSWPWTVC